MKTKLFLSLALVAAAIVAGTLMGGPSAIVASFGTVRQVTADNNRFAVDLYSQLRAQNGNVFFSPCSISTALAMTYAGAQGNTATQMAQTLHFDSPAEDLHPAFAELQSSLNAAQKEGHVELSVANSLWPQKGFSFLPDYLALCQKDYGVSITPLDFAGDTEAARQTINDWVSDKTQKKITDLLSPDSLSSTTRLVLVNGIYFKGKWAKQFEPNATQDQPFYTSSVGNVRAPLMEQTGDFCYAEFPDLQVLAMPYQGNQFSMVVLLPGKVDGLGALEAQLNATNLAFWIDGLPSQKVEVFFPKFTATSEFSLKDTLTAMGMTEAFDSDAANFSGMDGTNDLYIGAVIHKAYVKVDEEGTEAAAATGVVMWDKAAAEPAPPPVFRADHPFIFLIRDNRTGSILFLGRMTDPTL